MRIPQSVESRFGYSDAHAAELSYNKSPSL